jgi:hypothetical protein
LRLTIDEAAIAQSARGFLLFGIEDHEIVRFGIDWNRKLLARCAAARRFRLEITVNNPPGRSVSLTRKGVISDSKNVRALAVFCALRHTLSQSARAPPYSIERAKARPWPMISSQERLKAASAAS